MKKRLLALALCLVMMSIVLPVTAAADDNPAKNWIVGIEDLKTYCNEASFTINCPEGYSVYFVGVDKNGSGGFDPISPVEEQYKISGHSGPIDVSILFQGANSNPTVHLHITINDDHTGIEDHICDICGERVHIWQFKASGNTLTGTCGVCGQGVSVSLVADSVTLPNNPFNARLVGWEEFRNAVPTADHYAFEYKCDGVAITDQSNPKAGNYQAGVRIYGLPGTVENSDVAARATMNSAYLFTHYTAADPEITAQTGDNRPIELMMASLVVFSALASAAFILDNRRKYSR